MNYYTLYCTLSIITVSLFLFAVTEQYRIYRKELNGLRNLRKAIIIYILLMIAITLMIFFEAEQIYIGAALLLCGMISFLIHIRSEFKFLSFKEWKEFLN